MDLVIGIGEIGKPLAELFSKTRNVIRKDIKPLILSTVDTLHICYPYSNEFVKTTTAYIAYYNPALVIIHSTIVPGTTRNIAQESQKDIAYSPVRGRHTQMDKDLLHYTKFVSGTSGAIAKDAQAYLDNCSLKTERMMPCEALELAKLLETSYSALLIAWTQEMHRYGNRLGFNFNEALRFIDEVPYLPRYRYYPGHIGGHCLIQNLDLLEQVRESPFIKAIRESNESCTEYQKQDKTRHKARKVCNVQERCSCSKC